MIINWKCLIYDPDRNKIQLSVSALPLTRTKGYKIMTFVLILFLYLKQINNVLPEHKMRAQVMDIARIFYAVRVNTCEPACNCKHYHSCSLLLDLRSLITGSYELQDKFDICHTYTRNCVVVSIVIDWNGISEPDTHNWFSRDKIELGKSF